MQPDQLPANKQAQPHPGQGLIGRAVEPVKDQPPLLKRHAGAGIGHSNLHQALPVRRAGLAQTDLNGTGRRGEFGGIVNQVGQDLFEPFAISPDWRQMGRGLELKFLLFAFQ